MMNDKSLFFPGDKRVRERKPTGKYENVLRTMRAHVQAYCERRVLDMRAELIPRNVDGTWQCHCFLVSAIESSNLENAQQIL